MGHLACMHWIAWYSIDKFIAGLPPSINFAEVWPSHIQLKDSGQGSNQGDLMLSLGSKPLGPHTTYDMLLANNFFLLVHFL